MLPFQCACLCEVGFLRYGVLFCKMRKEKIMTKSQRTIVLIAAVFALSFGILPAANAMHIMEGYLPAKFCIAWGVVCVPFLIAGFFSIKKTLSGNRKLIMILAMVGRMPSSCPHLRFRLSQEAVHT